MRRFSEDIKLRGLDHGYSPVAAESLSKRAFTETTDNLSAK
jgi:hypothetical protein